VNQQIHFNTKKEVTWHVTPSSQKNLISIIGFFIYNVMNLAVNYNSHGRICNMVIHVQLLVLDVKMNYVELKLILDGSTQSNSQIQTCINK
jgi:hypothetical protein